MDNIDPRNIRFYGNGNGMLPESNAVERPDDLIENAIYVEGEADGSFDISDYILFYGMDAVKWTYNYFNGFFEHKNNLYTDEVNYFITTDLVREKGSSRMFLLQKTPHISSISLSIIRCMILTKSTF